MAEIEISRTVAAPAARLWAVLADYGHPERFGPAVARAEIISPNATGVDAVRVCTFHDGNSVEERVLTWKEGEALTVALSGSMPIVGGVAGFRLQAVDKATTEVTASMRYTPKFGILGLLMDRMMMRRRMEDLLRRTLEGLDHHVRTGDPIDERWIHGAPSPA